MPKFPTRESDVLALCDRMIAGFEEFGTTFPHADLPALQAKRAAYNTAKEDQIVKQAAAELATTVKEEAQAALIAFMTSQIKQSEVDCFANPEMLKYIGWGPRTAPSPVALPGQPRDLAAVIQGYTTVHLDWKFPARGSGGAVRTYLIQRREAVTGGAFGPWKQVGVSLETEATLIDQPRGQQLEYWVIAVNGSGESTPSNTASAVL